MWVTWEERKNPAHNLGTQEHRGPHWPAGSCSQPEFPFQLRAVGSESPCPQHSKASRQTGALGLVTSKSCPAYQVPPNSALHTTPPPQNLCGSSRQEVGQEWKNEGTQESSPQPPSNCSPEARDCAYHPHRQVRAPESQGPGPHNLWAHYGQRNVVLLAPLFPTHFRPSICSPAAPALAHTGAQKDATPVSGTCGLQALLA